MLPENQQEGGSLMDYKREFLKLRGWTFEKEPLYTKGDGHGSRVKVYVYGHREYAIKDNYKLSQHEAWELEHGKYLFELAVNEK